MAGSKNKWSIFWFPPSALHMYVHSHIHNTYREIYIYMRIVGEDESYVNMALMPVYPIVA